VKTIIVLAMHGMPPSDFPREETAEAFKLHAQLEQVQGAARNALEARYTAITARMRAWPRNAQNDPFAVASEELALALRHAVGHPVIAAYNEFCGPSLDEAFDLAAARGAEQIVVVTPMMTRGGEHSEVDIPAAIARGQARYPGVPFRYAWPFDVAAVAGFLAAQVLPLCRE
jgi:sirohydrochlorin cobaltochelatase